MTNEELQRIRQYSDKVQVAQGNLMVLSKDESQDLEMLLRKWMDENGIK